MQVELEIEGGATAGYLSGFRKRHFNSPEAAGRYMDRVAAHLSERGVRAAHSMRVFDTSGRDVTHLCHGEAA